VNGAARDDDRARCAPTAVIADDEPLLRDALRDALARAWPALRIVAECGDGDAALAAIRRVRPDVAFLDIRMPGRSGLEVAGAAAADDGAPLWVFVTAHDEHALEAFDREAIDYLLKPIDAARLLRTVTRLQDLLAAPAAPSAAREAASIIGVQALQRIAALLEQPAAAPPLRWLRASLRDEVRLIPIADVVAFEAADKYLRVLTRDGEALVRMPLKELLERLPVEEFWQIHRGTVVRAADIDRTVRTLSGGLRVHLRSRPERFEVSRAFAHLFRAD
jgi:DNA-binding LytR/AlgR family response regulator